MAERVKGKLAFREDLKSAFIVAFMTKASSSSAPSTTNSEKPEYQRILQERFEIRKFGVVIPEQDMSRLVHAQVHERLRNNSCFSEVAKICEEFVTRQAEIPKTPGLLPVFSSVLGVKDMIWFISQAAVHRENRQRFPGVIVEFFRRSFEQQRYTLRGWIRRVDGSWASSSTG